MPTVAMIDLPPSQYASNGPRYHWDDRGRTITWPCPRCAATLTAVGTHGAEHDCTHPKAHVTGDAARARVAAWWAGYDAAKANAEPCHQNHVPDGGHCIVIEPADGPAVILTTGGAHAPSYLLTDQTPSADDVFDLARKPVLRAVLAARLTAMADLLAPTPEGAPQ